MVRAIKPDGRLKMDLVGGFVYNSIEGENCTVHLAKSGKEISGTILLHQTSVHVYKDAGSAERNQANMEVRLDEKSQRLTKHAHLASKSVISSLLIRVSS